MDIFFAVEIFDRKIKRVDHDKPIQRTTEKLL